MWSRSRRSMSSRQSSSVRSSFCHTWRERSSRYAFSRVGRCPTTATSDRKEVLALREEHSGCKSWIIFTSSDPFTGPSINTSSPMEGSRMSTLSGGLFYFTGPVLGYSHCVFGYHSLFLCRYLLFCPQKLIEPTIILQIESPRKGIG